MSSRMPEPSGKGRPAGRRQGYHLPLRQLELRTLDRTRAREAPPAAGPAGQPAGLATRPVRPPNLTWSACQPAVQAELGKAQSRATPSRPGSGLG